MIHKVTRYMTFREVSATAKTITVHVTNNASGGLLGQIKWYAPWRQYCFFPADDCVFNHSCLTEIVQFIQIIGRPNDAQ